MSVSSPAASQNTIAPASARRFTGLRDFAQVFRRKRLSEPVKEGLGSMDRDGEDTGLPPDLQILAPTRQSIGGFEPRASVVDEPPNSPSSPPPASPMSPSPMRLPLNPALPPSNSPSPSPMRALSLRRRGAVVGEISFMLSFNKYNEQLVVSNVALRNLGHMLESMYVLTYDAHIYI